MNNTNEQFSPRGSKSVLGLDFGKYLISSERRRGAMESDNTTGTESDTSDWDLANAALTSEYSEDSDDYGIYYGEDQMYDTQIGGNQDAGRRMAGNQMSDRQTNLQMRKILNQMNSSAADSGYSGSSTLYPIHETGLTTTDSSGNDENSDGTLSNSGSPVHTGYPVYGRYQKLPTHGGTTGDNVSDMEDGLDNLMLHRLPGENLGMILGIEGGKHGVGKITSVAVKSVTLGGAAYRATGSSKGICVGDDIVMVNGLDLRTLSHDECIQVFKDMPLRVLLKVKRGQKDLPAFSVSPLPSENKNEAIQKLGKRSENKTEVPVQIKRRRDGSDSEDDGFGGFATYNVTINKDPEENLGISIVPSYGSTREYYQIKRILPSGSAAHSGELQVGDRLIKCNGTNLRALKQSQCLDIIKSASSSGILKFEVVRPVYNGSSMEISVTLNNGTNSYSNLPSFDPSQYSLKSQSYDRNVDVVVTSESEDYLTVSEDEYSRSGRLADIPEVEANEVFVSNSVRLAYQAPLNTLEEESAGTESEPSPRKLDIIETENIKIVDLNKIETSPYHIPNKQDSRKNIDLKQYKIAPKLEKDLETSPRSKSELSDTEKVPVSDLDKVSPRSPIPRSDLDQISPRSPVPNTDIDNISLSSSFYSRQSQSPRFEPGRSSPRSPIPNTDIDNISVESYTKRQQIPSDSDSSHLNLPYNYPSESVGKNIPVSDSEETRYNPLYEDSNLSEYTDSETQETFQKRSYLEVSSNRVIASSDQSSNKTLTQSEVDVVSDSSENESVGVPPPAEFSDNHYNNSEENPVSNIDDFISESYTPVETTPVNDKRTFSHRSKSTLDSFENLPTDVNVEHFEDDHDAHLAFNSELTAPFDLVLQEQGICVQSGDDSIDEFEEHQNNEILQVVTSYDNGSVLISQFEPDHLKERTDSPVYCVTSFEHSDNTMDHNSEAMLKDALDMEYENLPESAKFEARLKLGDNVTNGNGELDDSCDMNENPVAENIAKEIVQNEKGNYGYFLESDDEPDNFPDQDAPEDAPDLPDMPPPPMMNNTGSHSENGVTVNVVANGNDISDNNWSFKKKSLENGNDGTDDDIIVPIKVERKVEIQISSKVKENEDDIIVPVSAKRDFKLPETFVERAPSPRNDDENIDMEFTKKIPPPVHPKPKRNIISVGDSDTVEVEEEIITAKEVKRDNTKQLVNVINVVNALKAGAKDKDPNILDQMEKSDAKDRVKSVFSSVIRVAGKDSGKDISQVEMSPPKQEQISTVRDEISFSRQPRIESSPPKQDIVEEVKEVITKPTVSDRKQTNVVLENKPEEPPVLPATEVPVLKTSITVDKQNDVKSISTKSANETVNKSPSTLVPPLNLNFTSSANTDSVSPKNDKSGGNSPSYKTTIGVPKQQPPVPSVVPQEPVHQTSVDVKSNTSEIKNISKTKEPVKLAPTPQIKSLSQIKPLSFNPKSLSQTSSRPVQYKTSIGVKSGLSSLTRPSSQKADHPIKRMESLPFEVSILKGILGIGIKTVMTPEGHVKVTEILPNGPVGREGNIKVGDFILSINGTQLSGLNDGKVQQILRLLPRGLSKIVASAVIPDQNADSSGDAQVEKPTLAARQSLPLSSSEKTKLSPRQSSPLSSPRQPTITTNPNASTLLSRQPVAAPRVIPTQQPQVKKAPPTVAPKPASRPSVSPVTSPRSPVVESRSPNASPRLNKGETTIFQHQRPSPTESPVVSPRQQDVLPMSPKTPPPVAPKPRKTPNKPVESPVEDLSKPIEAELFVSINATNESSPKPGSNNILPGSINYDVVEGGSKTKWTAGMVSSADLDVPAKQNEIKGNLNVVDDTETQNTDVVNDTNSPQNENINNSSSQIVDTECMIKKELPETKDKDDNAISDVVEKLNDLGKDFESSQVDVSILSNRSRTFSSSSNASSYTDFNECDVDGENIPEQIVEEEETDLNVKPSPHEQIKDAEYESDFEEEENRETTETDDGSKESDNRVQSPDSGLDMDHLKSLAETIVTDVISSIKQSDFEKVVTKDEQTAEDLDNAPELPSEAPPMPTSPPPTAHDSPTPRSQAPPLPDGPPPIPDTEIPVVEATPATVVDLALYPDSDHSSEGTTENKQKQDEKEVSEVVDIVDISISTTLHAAAPNVPEAKNDVVVDQDSVCDNTDGISNSDILQNDIQTDSSMSQVIEDSRDQEGDKVNNIGNNININGDNSDELSVSNVISMYSNLEKSLDEQKSEEIDNISEANNNVIDKDANVVNDEPEVKLSSSDNEIIPKADAVTDSVEKENVQVELNVQCEIESYKATPEKINGHTDTVFDKANKSKSSGKEEVASPKLESLSPRLGSLSPRLESLSPRSDSDSPRSETKFVSRVDRILSETEDLGRGKCSPEIDRMIRMFSTSEEPVPEGEGEIIDIVVNKGVTGLGFIIQGGKSTPKGDMPISVKRVFKGGPADGVLQVRDELLLVNGEDLSDMRHSEAWSHFKFLPSGDIVMKVRRYQTE